MGVVRSQIGSYFFQIANGVIPLAFILIMYRIYDFEEMADYFLALSISGLVVMVVDFGYNLSPIRDLEALSSDRLVEIAPEKMLLILFSKAFIFLATTPVLFILSKWSLLPVSPIFLVYIYIISVLTSLTNIQWLLFSLNDSICFARALFVFRIFSVLIFILSYFSYIDMSIEIATLFLLSIPLLANLYVLVSYKSYFSLKIPESHISVSKVMAETLKSATVFINTSIDSGVKISWPLVLFWVSDSKELVSFYGGIERLVKSVYMLFSPLQFFLLANATSLSTLRDHVDRLPFRRLVFFVALGFLLAPFLIYSVIYITKWPLGDTAFGYDLSVIGMYVFHPYILIANLLTYTYLVHHNWEASLTKTLLISVLAITVVVLFEVGSIILYPLYYDALVLGILVMFVVRRRALNGV